jgi:D-glycero-alpha-D-manno-heptose 1-phosphate guanylyltransferase
MSQVIGAILAGGLGTRLRSVVSDRPKVLADVLGKPFLARLLDQLAEAGLDRVVLLTGYRGEQVRETFGDRYGTLSLDYSIETEPLGTAGALRLALPKLFPAAARKYATQSVLVLNGDSYCDADLRGFRAFHGKSRADGSLVLAQVADTARFGKVETAAHHRLLRFLEKQEAGGPGAINAGIYLLNRPLVEEIPEGRAVSIEREMFPEWFRTRKMLGFACEGAFLDIGTPESYQAAEQFFARLGESRDAA